MLWVLLVSHGKSFSRVTTTRANCNNWTGDMCESFYLTGIHDRLCCNARNQGPDPRSVPLRPSTVYQRETVSGAGAHWCASIYEVSPGGSRTLFADVYGASPEEATSRADALASTLTHNQEP